MPNRPTILLIEDDTFTTDMMAEKLHEEGFTTESATSAEEAKPIIERRAGEISLIVLDILLPGDSGIQLLEYLRADGRYRTLPVIMLTNLDRSEERERCHALGVTDYLVKAHHNLPEIIERIKAALAARSA